MKVSLFRTCFGGIVLKTKIYAMTSAGSSQMSAPKIRSKLRIPSHAGKANDSNKPTDTQSNRCHQIGSMGVPQTGQLSYGGRVLIPSLRSVEQLGQALHDLLEFSVAGMFAAH
jgi:hypothetical protein